MLPNDELDETGDSYASPFYSPNEYLDTERLRPFRTIWTRPRETIRKIVATNPDLHIGLIAVLGGIDRCFDRSSVRDPENTVTLTIFIVASLVVGPAVFLFCLWFGSHLLRFTGRWIGGKASHKHLTVACVWAWVPIAFSLVLWIPRITLLGSNAFTEDWFPMDADPMLALLLFAIVLAELFLGIWGVVLLANTVAEVQGFRSAWAGFGNLFLACLIYLIPMMTIVLGWRYFVKPQFF